MKRTTTVKENYEFRRIYAKGGPAFRRTLWSTSARTGGGVTASA
ncbi:MAG: hypothetical protein ACLR1M_06400 [Oscillospiraceae bacterium]